MSKVVCINSKAVVARPVAQEDAESIEAALTNWTMMCRFAEGKSSSSPVNLAVRKRVQGFTEEQLMEELVHFSLAKAVGAPDFYRSVTLEILARDLLKYPVTPQPDPAC